MKPEQLDEIERVAKAATPGPWQWINPENDRPRQSGEWRSSLRTVEEFPTISVGSLPKFIVEADEIYGENMDANAAFIAAANPTTVLSLIAEVKRLREDAERYDFVRSRAELRACDIGCYWYIKTIDVPMGMPVIDATLANVIDLHRKENPNGND